MPTPEEIMIAQLDAADLQPALYRTARRIIDRLNPANNYCRVTYDELAAIVSTDNQATARAHLTRLAAAGLITYRRNSAVHIYWHADAPTVSTATPAQETEPLPATPPAMAPETSALSSESRALDPTLVDDAVSKTRALSSESRALDPTLVDDAVSKTRALSSESRANCSKTRALSSESRAASLKATTTGRQAGLETTASQPAGRGPGKPQPQQPQMPAAASFTDEQQASMAMLMDSDIGLDLIAAERIARRYANGLILAHCCRYLRDLASGKVKGPAVIGHRLAKAYGASILPADHRTAFWQRHGQTADDGGEAERRRKYFPAEYADIIIG